MQCAYGLGLHTYMLTCLHSDVGRTLSAGGYIDDTLMTDESCISYCSGLGLQYAGVEYYHECCMKIS